MSGFITNSTSSFFAPGIFQSSGTSAIYVSAKTIVISGTAGTNALDDLTLGYFGGVEGFDGKIAEVLVYDAALTLAEINATLAYLGSKYNISIGA